MIDDDDDRLTDACCIIYNINYILRNVIYYIIIDVNNKIPFHFLSIHYSASIAMYFPSDHI